MDEIADELDVPSSHVAIAWAKSKDQQLFPIIGATRVEHIEESINAIDLNLNDYHIQRLNDVTEFNHGFPQSFVGADNVHELINGDTYAKLENHQFRGF